MPKKKTHSPRIVHAADIHLGAKFPNFDREMEKMKSNDIIAAFTQLIEYVIVENIDVLIIAGDLFDNPNPDAELVKFVFSKFSDIYTKNPECKVILLHGECDTSIIPAANIPITQPSVISHHLGKGTKAQRHKGTEGMANGEWRMVTENSNNQQLTTNSQHPLAIGSQQLPDYQITKSPNHHQPSAISHQLSTNIITPLTFFDSLPNVKIFGLEPKPETIELEISGRKIVISSYKPTNPEDFDNININSFPDCNDGFGIFAFHCKERKSSIEWKFSESIFKEKILIPLYVKGYKYFALGHRHKIKLLSIGSSIAVFPGSIERLDMEKDRDKKFFIRFDIGDNFSKDTLVPIQVRVRPIEYFTFNCFPETNLEELLESSIKSTDKTAILYIVLEGQFMVKEFYKFQRGALLEKLRANFASIHIDNKLFLLEEGQTFNFGALRIEQPAEEFRHYVEREREKLKNGSEEKILLEELLAIGLQEIKEGL